MHFPRILPRREASRQDLSSPISPFVGLHQEMDRLFEDFFGSDVRGYTPTSGFGALDLAETEDGYEMKVDLPGLKEDDIDISVADHILTLRAERSSEHEEKKKDFHRAERSYGLFARQIALPQGVDEDALRAEFESGVLTLTLPKAPEAKKEVRHIRIGR